MMETKIKIFADDSLRRLEERSNLWLKENDVGVLFVNYQIAGVRADVYMHVLIITYK